MVLSALAVLMLQQGVMLQKPISYETSAKPARVVVEELSTLAGIHLEAPQAMGNEMLILRFKDVPAQICLDKIALAVHGHWERMQDGMELVRGGEEVQKATALERANRLEAMRQRIAKRVAALKPFDEVEASRLYQLSQEMSKRMAEGGASGAWLRYQTLAEQKPAGRMLTRILASVPPEVLADLPDNSRVVFATSPTRMQRPLDASVLGVARDYQREQSIWSQQFGSAVQVSDTEELIAGSESSSARNAIPAKALLVCLSSDMTDGMFLEFKVVDAQGRLITDSYSAFLEDDPTVRPAPPSVPDDIPIHLSALAQELGDHSLSLWEGSTLGQDTDFHLKPISPELRQLLLDPEHHDPLALFPSEPILTAARAADVNVAVCVDDTAIDTMGSFRGRKARSTLTQMPADLGSGTFSDGWLIASPRHPFNPRHEDRRALGTFLRSLDRLGRFSLDAMAQYAQGVPDDFSASLGGRLAVPLTGLVQAFEYGQDWQFLRLYGALTPSQKRSMLEGTGILAANLTPLQQSILARIIFVDADIDVAPVDAPDEDTAQEVYQSVTSLMREPTELLPNGLDPNCTLTMSLDKEDVLYPVDASAGRPSMVEGMDYDSVALGIFLSRHPSELKVGDDESGWSAFHIGSRSLYTMSIALPKGMRASGSVSDDNIQPKAMTFQELPAEIRKSLEDKIAEQERWLKESKSGGSEVVPGRTGGVRVPPPAR